MPGKNHEEFEKAQKDGKGMKSKFQAARDAMYQKRLKDMGVGKKGKKGDGYKYTDGHKKKRRSPPMRTVSPLTQEALVGSSTSSSD